MFSAARIAASDFLPSALSATVSPFSDVTTMKKKNNFLRILKTKLKQFSRKRPPTFYFGTNASQTYDDCSVIEFAINFLPDH